jgi:shikimate dehydrogenase
MRALGIDGLNVTMPHKHDVVAELDAVSSTEAALQAVNTIHRLGDDLHGESTDGAGFVDALVHDEGFAVAGARVVVLGAGGAARAVVLALADAGAADVAVVNRTAERARRAVELAPSVARLGTTPDDVADADLVVNATPIGMHDTPTEEALPLDPKLLKPGQVVVDLVYHPLRTPLLAAARERGSIPVTGLGMLIHQAAHAFRLWTGEDPPLEVMSAAALAKLRETWTQ